MVDKLYAAIASALQQQEAKDLLLKYQMYVINSSPEASAKKLAELTVAYAEIAEKAGIKPQ